MFERLINTLQGTAQSPAFGHGPWQVAMPGFTFGSCRG